MTQVKEKAMQMLKDLPDESKLQKSLEFTAVMCYAVLQIKEILQGGARFPTGGIVRERCFCICRFGEIPKPTV